MAGTTGSRPALNRAAWESLWSQASAIARRAARQPRQETQQHAASVQRWPMSGRLLCGSQMQAGLQRGSALSGHELHRTGRLTCERKSPEEGGSPAGQPLQIRAPLRGQDILGLRPGGGSDDVKEGLELASGCHISRHTARAPAFPAAAPPEPDFPLFYQL